MDKSSIFANGYSLEEIDRRFKRLDLLERRLNDFNNVVLSSRQRGNTDLLLKTFHKNPDSIIMVKTHSNGRYLRDRYKDLYPSSELVVRYGVGVNDLQGNNCPVLIDLTFLM